jgi:hypothetical protein
MPGRHAAPTGAAFYRDLLIMGGGMLVVAVLVFLGATAIFSSNRPSTTTEVAGTRVTAPTTASPTSSTVIVTTSTLRPTTTTTATTQPEVRPPSELRVLVLNSLGVTGLAARLTERLAELGYQTLEPDNYQPAQDVTLVVHAPGFALEAFELAALVDPVAIIQEDPGLEEGVDLVVVLGASYQE